MASQPHTSHAESGPAECVTTRRALTTPGTQEVPDMAGPHTTRSPSPRNDDTTPLQRLGAVLYVLLLCALLVLVTCVAEGCASGRSVVVEGGGGQGTGTPLYATASHVTEGSDTAVVTDEGRRILCDVVPLARHLAPWGRDGLSLLLPRSWPWRGREEAHPGDSGRPVWDYRGRLAWLHLGRDEGEQVLTPIRYPLLRSD